VYIEIKVRSDMYTASSTDYYILSKASTPNTVLHRSHDEIVKLDKKRTDRPVITVLLM
jgi:hypothetical protein